MSVFDELHNVALSDNDLLRKNDSKGDVFRISRDVDFAFKTDHRERAEALSDFVNGKNYGSAKVVLSDDKLVWVFVVIHMPITQHLLCAVSGFMVCLSRLFQVEYDGWGSVMQTEASES